MAQRLTGAASDLLTGVLQGPPRSLRVVTAVPSAVHLLSDDGEVAVSVCTADAVRLPNAVVLAAPPAVRPLRMIRSGQPAQVGDGLIWIGEPGSGQIVVRVSRWWRARRPQLRKPWARTAAELARRLSLTDGLEEPVAIASETFAAALTGQAVLSDAVSGLIGLGSGLTPAGDDVLAGAIVTLRAAQAPHADELAGTITTALTSSNATTPVSATLLRYACDGYCVPQLTAVLEDPTTLEALLAVGHTSGKALAHGALIGLRTVTGRHTIGSSR